ncbi:DUF2461 domain-containing protein [Sphingobium sp. HBC34]|uniref:DUF2461 domain-containing protein n=1 Tax=Sphingobium cyanobacteriorum TaxID=3063954 RepID=A0ABT8ZTX4_9SPHN|nr:DUF2461 domain-containing protein [Sphingobium sp. HBC34]MDO7837190.1 DUF2461 domain-containing protein [Sphingobium sp. HBC34]
MSWLSAETVHFLADLRANNDRDWFARHKNQYELSLKQPGEAFAAAMANELASRRGTPHDYRIFRIHRDVRFSRDKAPFNAHLHISFSSAGGCKDGAPVWMFGLDHDGLTLGAGIFAFSAHQLERWRDLCAAPAGERMIAKLGTIARDGIRLSEPELKRVPAPYPADHPRGAELRRKGLTAWIDRLDPSLAFGPEGAARCVKSISELQVVFETLTALG